MDNTLLFISAIIGNICITALIEKILIPYLRRRAKQPIYEGGPSWHMSKSGTPTMGGIAFLISSLITLAAISYYFIGVKRDLITGTAIIIPMLYAAANALVGIADDLTKLRKKENAGLSPAEKLILQFLIAIIFLLVRAHLFDDNGVIYLSFTEIDLGIFYYPLSIILLLGIINCANLTDGVDGLASSTSLTIGLVFLIYATVKAIGEAAILSAVLIGLSAGFLIFNRHPAKIFMGDTGSLFLGAFIIAIGYCTKNPFSVILIGGVYVIEGVSVILQVICYKLTKKRIFKMAPIHHHLEKCGLSENKICIIAVATTLFLSIISFIVFR